MVSAPDTTAWAAGSQGPRKFLIMGLPRSGTTYLMSLLNSHRAVYCTGEQYNPHARVALDPKDDDDSHETIIARDSDPVGFLGRVFGDMEGTRHSRIGFKYMLGHNVRLLEALEQRPDIALIHVWRENRLAQVSSLLRAIQDQVWAETRPRSEPAPKIAATPREISQRWHEYATTDYLFRSWLAQQPHHQISLEYCALFQPDINARLSAFLDLPVARRLKSNLIKQNPNTVLDRFADPRHIAYYFRTIGYGRWLEPEL